MNNEQHKHMHDEHQAHAHEKACTAHAGDAGLMCSCDHNPGGECHCPPNECKCDQEHHLIGEVQVGHACCEHGGEHDDRSAHAGHDMHGDHAGHHGHGDHSHHDPAIFKKQFWFAFALTVPAIYFSHAIQMIFGYQAVSFPFSNFIPAVAGAILFFTGGRVFLTTGWQEIKAKQPGMMALIAMALIVAFGYSATLTAFELAG